MARRPAEITCIPEYAPDKAAMLAALKIVLRQPLNPVIALQQSEAHARECVTCRLDGQDSCTDGRWYLERAERAAKEEEDRATCRTDAATARPARAAAYPGGCGLGTTNDGKKPATGAAH